MDEKLLEETISILQDAVISNQRHILTIQDSVILSHKALINVQDLVMQLADTVSLLAKALLAMTGLIVVLVVAVILLAQKYRHLQIAMDNLAKKQTQQDFINSKTNQLYEKVILNPIKKKSKSKKEA
jgi:hypothetical protein